MALIENTNTLEIWLESKSRIIARAMVTRAILRIVPLLSVDFEVTKDKKRYRQYVILPVFRTVARQWADVKYSGRSNPEHPSDRFQLDLISGVESASNSLYMGADSVSRNAARAVAAATGGIRIDYPTSTKASFRQRAIEASAIAASAVRKITDRSIFWSAIESDASLLDSGISANKIATFPLWTPLIDAEIQLISQHWDTMKTRLLATGEDWDVWTDWYDERLAGKEPRWDDIELLRAGIGGELFARNIRSYLVDASRENPGDFNLFIKENIYEKESINSEEKVKQHEAASGLKRKKIEDLIEQVRELENSAIGARIIERDDRLVIDPTGHETDKDAAGDPITAQLQTGILRRARAFTDTTHRLDNQFGWRGIHAVVMRLIEAIECDTNEIPARLGTTYETVVEIATFLDQDNMIVAGDRSGIDKLDPDARRQLSSLVVATAPWIRRFPSVRQLDDEAGAFLTRPELYEPSSAIVKANVNAGVLGLEDATALQLLLDAAQRGEFQGRKASARAFFSIRNLIAVSMTALLTVELGAIGSVVAGSDSAIMSPLARKIGHALIDGEVALAEFLAGEAADIRLAAFEIIRQAKSGKLPQDFDTPIAPPPSPPRPTRIKP